MEGNKIFLVLCILFCGQVWSKSLQDEADLSLTILHINDIHAHFEEVNENVGRCHEHQKAGNQCFGGAARMMTKINEIRDKSPDTTLLLNAGDYYQGTIWYSIFKYKPVLEFANYFNYDAMGVGNHDFDDGDAGLLPFLDEANFPILAANIEIAEDSILNGRINKSVILDVNGQKVGIVGYLINNSGVFGTGTSANLTLLDEVEYVAKEATRLKEEDGIEIIIATGHAGYDVDMRMAEEAVDVDLVVGGHSHTYLFTGEKPPSIETPRGAYPTYVKQKSGKVVPVVQVYCYTKYLGHLELSFKDGELMEPVDGVGVSFAEPIILDGTVDKDPDILEAMAPWLKDLEEFKEEIGNATVNLFRNGAAESNIGNMLTNAIAECQWDNTKIAFMNNGGIRSDLIAGNIIVEDIYNVWPFNNSIDRIHLTGKFMDDLFERYASTLCPDKDCDGKGSFYQVAGLKIDVFVTGDNSYDRVTIKTTDCGTEKKGCEHNPKVTDEELWCDLEMDKVYTVAAPSYLADYWKPNDNEDGMPDYDCLENYIRKYTPIDQQIEGRFVVRYEDDPIPTTTTTQEPETTTAGSAQHIANIFLAVLMSSMLTFLN